MDSFTPASVFLCIAIQTAFHTSGWYSKRPEWKNMTQQMSNLILIGIMQHSKFQMLLRPPGTIAIVLKPGYVLHDRVLRPAEVGVTVDVSNE
ncbi:hypothetical protein RHMOL_Rhmol06G0305300 [Rhododendron molle]|uniref:Uncharacterized protein n=1 Tax=Rhododendron molle TaxID=49168 RepID=A0ACC0NIU1_RHOML|nr:hypothetical protein RHMOL_Rhmol06G0305300 [Rhododendron molle]